MQISKRNTSRSIRDSEDRLRPLWGTINEALPLLECQFAATAGPWYDATLRIFASFAAFALFF